MAGWLEITRNDFAGIKWGEGDKTEEQIKTIPRGYKNEASLIILPILVEDDFLIWKIGVFAFLNEQAIIGQKLKQKLNKYLAKE